MFGHRVLDFLCTATEDQTTVKKNLPKLACATDDVSCSYQQKRRISSREDLANVAHPAMEQGDPWQRHGFPGALAGNDF